MFDLIIIGAGPGGFEAAITALRKGLNIAIVEKDKLGGNCLNRACVPTKYFWIGAHTIEKLKVFNEYGIDIKDFSLDYSKAWEGKEKAISFLRKSVSQLFKTKKVPVFKGIGKIIDKNKVKVLTEDGSEKIIEGKYILIATGSKPIAIGNLIPDGEYILTTEDYMDKLKKLPESILIVGGGVAGCELGYIMNRYGVDVHIVELKNRILPLPFISEEAAKLIMRKFKQLGIKLHLETTVEKLEIKNNKVFVKLSSSDEIMTVDKVLLSVGRKPNTDIDEIGLEKDEKGFIKTNEYLQTSVENIYACGDVVNSPMLAHVAMYEAKVAVHNIVEKNKKKVDYSLIPSAVFTVLEIGQIGLTEEQAKEKGIETITGYFPFMYNDKAVDEHEKEGFVRLIFEKNSKKLLGATIVGASASELLHIMEIAIKKEMTAEEIHEFVYFHPSLSEIFAYATYDIAVGSLFRK
ncbi:MAG: dihydrolipoyl dehydrogenase [Aquificae bacterium]|nr:dihydrolipoyl dehydrogenase [Aquificota bacterium]